MLLDSPSCLLFSIHLEICHVCIVTHTTHRETEHLLASLAEGSFFELP